MFYPLEQKEPELVKDGIDAPIRKEIAFALGQLKRFEDAIKEFNKCLQSDPNNFYFHSGLAFTIYNCLFAARNREIVLPYKTKKEYISKAHHHFKRAQALRPHGVTNFYREGMLFKNIQNKISQAMPLFLQAVKNWESYTTEQKARHHQEYKNYIKSLYNLASCQLKTENPKEALNNIVKCIELDKEKNYLKNEYKYFALGKIHYQLKELKMAREDLEFAATFVSAEEGDYIIELLSRVLLELGRKEEAFFTIKKIPPKRKRAFVCWTEADILLALGKIDDAINTLRISMEKDRRSRHKTLIKLSKIAFRKKDYKQALAYAREANEFHLNTYTTPDADGLFWMAVNFIYLKEFKQAKQTIRDLSDFRPGYILLPKLRAAYRESLKNSEILQQKKGG